MSETLKMRMSETLKKRLRDGPSLMCLYFKTLRSYEETKRTPPKCRREVTDFANPDCIRSNCTLHRSDFLGRQMPRGIVHALDRYCMCYITMSEHVHARPLFDPLGFESMLV